MGVRLLLRCAAELQEGLCFTEELALLCEKHCTALQDFTGVSG